jgi:hypothetical protein
MLDHPGIRQTPGLFRAPHQGKEPDATVTIQKSAGVNVIFESSGFLSLLGLYSACQPKISPCHG